MTKEKCLSQFPKFSVQVRIPSKIIWYIVGNTWVKVSQVEKLSAFSLTLYISVCEASEVKSYKPYTYAIIYTNTHRDTQTYTCNLALD